MACTANVSALGKKLRGAEGGALLFRCQGCGVPHRVWVGEGPGPRWSWNGDADQPTFTPSVLVTWSEPANLHNHEAMQRDLADARRRREAGEHGAKVPQAAKVCHSFITGGRIQFLGDCTHSLAGSTVELPDWDTDKITV